MFENANPIQKSAILYALRMFVKDYDGKPQTPCTPSQVEVDAIKAVLKDS